MKITKLAVSLFVLGMCAPLLTFAAPALDSIPDELRSRYSFDGPIYAVVSNGETLYVGGEFQNVSHTITEITEPRATLAAFDVETLNLLPAIFDWNDESGGLYSDGVNALELSSDGEVLYIGGSYFYFCSEYDSGLGACDGDEWDGAIVALDTETNARTDFDSGIDSSVSLLALSPDDTELFAGGGFEILGGQNRFGLGAVTVADGLATAFEPTNNFTSLRDLAISPDGSVVYVIGDETLRVFDSETGDDEWSLELGASGYALAPSSDGNVLYVGGDFTAYTLYAGESEGVPFSQTTREPWETYPQVATQIPDTVYAVIPDGVGGWYIGGSFTDVDFEPQSYLAHIDASGVLDTDFIPDIDSGTVYALALDGTTLYVGGTFSSVDGVTTRNNVAAFNTTNGEVVVGFDPNINGSVFALALSSDGGTLFIGGDFTTVNGATSRNNIASVATADGVATDFNPDTNSEVNALALTADNSTLYMGGAFTSVNAGTTNDTRNRIAAFTTVGAGTLVGGFDPNVGGTAVHALLLNDAGTSLYVGGGFTTIGGEARVDFAELVIPEGTLTDLDVGIPFEGETVYAIGLSSEEETIYIGGSFYQIGGATQDNFGEVDVETGEAIDFNPNFNSTVLAIGVSATDLYVGGSFTSFAGLVDVSSVIALDPSDGSLISDFDPVFDGGVSDLALSSDDALLYAGGSFTEVDGETRSGIVALTTDDGSVAPFAPDNEYVFATMNLAGDDTKLYVGYYDGDMDFYRLLVFASTEDSGGDDDDDDDDDGGGGGGGSSSRSRTSQVSNPILEILTKLILTLQELIALMIAQQTT